MRTFGFCIALVILFVLFPSRSAAADAGPLITARASVRVLDAQGRAISSAKAHSIVTLSMSARLPQGYPTGYTDMRFTVFANGHAKRTIIYGTPKHVGAGSLVQIRLTTGVSPTWTGRVNIRGTIRILSRPGGIATGYAAQGITRLTVTR